MAKKKTVFSDDTLTPPQGELTKSGQRPAFNSYWSMYDTITGGYYGGNHWLTESVVVKMLRHPTLFLALEILKSPLIAHQDWSVECDDLEIKHFSENLLWMKWRKIMRLSCLALAFGRIPCEKIWYEISDHELTYKNDGQETKITYPYVWNCELKEIYPTLATINKESALENYHLLYADDIVIPPEKTYAYVVDGHFGNNRGRSRLLSAYEPWYDHVIITQALNRYLERHGSPSPVGWVENKGFKIAGRESEGEKSGLTWMTLALEKKMDGKPITLAAEFDKVNGLQKKALVEYLEDSGKSTPQFIESLKYKDDQMFRGVTLPEQVGSRGDVGSYSSDKTKVNTAAITADSTLQDMIENISDQILNPIVTYNFGKKHASAKIISQGLSDESKTLLKDILLAVINGKLARPDLNYISDAFNIPLEEIVQQPITPFWNQPSNNNQNPDDPNKAKEKIQLSEKNSIKFADYPNITLRRDLTEIEQKAGGVKRLSDNLKQRQSMETEFVNQIKNDILLPQIDKIRKEISYALKSSNPIKNIGDVTPIKSTLYEKSLQEYFRKIYDVGVTSVKDEKQAMSNGRINFNLAEPSISPDINAYIKTQSAQVAGSQSQKLSDILVNIAIGGYRDGKQETDILHEVESAIRDYADKNLSLIADTFGTEMLNQGRDDAASQLGALVAYYSSVLIETTCPLCEFMDGHYIAIDDPDYRRFSPPNHWNCYCSFIYIFPDSSTLNYEIDWETPPTDLVSEYKNLSEEHCCAK